MHLTNKNAFQDGKITGAYVGYPVQLKFLTTNILLTSKVTTTGPIIIICGKTRVTG